MKLFGYWRSSAAYRVRIALNLKQIPFESESVHLIKNGGEQHDEQFTALNPNELVPVLQDGDVVLHQSLAIIQYLEDAYPTPALLPNNAVDKAHVSALAFDIACEVHPLNNLRVQQYLANQLAIADNAKTQWLHHWMNLGFSAYEKQLQHCAGQYSFGDAVTLADICLIPQVYNAKRFNLPMEKFPLINQVTENCNQLSAFIDAIPENQHDAN